MGRRQRSAKGARREQARLGQCGAVFGIALNLKPRSHRAKSGCLADLAPSRWVSRLRPKVEVYPERLPRQSKGSTRSEEHTSELQSLMRISYAVFCLTQQNHLYHQHYH